MEYKIGSKKAVGFGLYEPVVLSSNLHDKFLFKIEILNYTIDVDLHSVEFDQSLDKIVAGNKK